MSTIQLLMSSKVGAPTTAKIFLSWKNICDHFVEKFDEQFHGKRKAHFDVLPASMRTVDGARGKWSLLVLLDAIVYLLNNDNPASTARRFFNQQRVLSDSILAELYSANTTYHEISEVDFENVCGDISVIGLSKQWVSLASFREYHNNNAPTKARAKFLSVLESLTTHARIMECFGDLPLVLKKVVLRVISEHGQTHMSNPFGAASNTANTTSTIASLPKILTASPLSPRSASRRSMSMDSAMEANLFLNTRSSAAATTTSPASSGHANVLPSDFEDSLSYSPKAPAPVFHQQYPLTPLQQPYRPTFLDDQTTNSGTNSSSYDDFPFVRPNYPAAARAKLSLCIPPVSAYYPTRSYSNSSSSNSTDISRGVSPVCCCPYQVPATPSAASAMVSSTTAVPATACHSSLKNGYFMKEEFPLHHSTSSDTIASTASSATEGSSGYVASSQQTYPLVCANSSTRHGISNQQPQQPVSFDNMNFYYQFRPSCSTIDENEQLRYMEEDDTNMYPAGEDSDVDGLNEGDLQMRYSFCVSPSSQPLLSFNGNPMSIVPSSSRNDSHKTSYRHPMNVNTAAGLQICVDKTMMDIVDQEINGGDNYHTVMTPKDSYDWDDFVQDFSRDHDDD